MASRKIGAVLLLLAMVQLSLCSDSVSPGMTGRPVTCSSNCKASFNESSCTYSVARDKRTDCKLCRCATKCEAEQRDTIQRSHTQAQTGQGGSAHIDVRACHEITHRYQIAQCNRTILACQCVDEYTGVPTTNYVARANVTDLPCVSFGRSDSRYCPRAAPQCPATFNASHCQFGQGRDQLGCLLCRCTGRCENDRFELAKLFSRGLSILKPPPQCSAAGEYSPIQCVPYYGCHCTNNTGGNTTLAVPSYLRSVLPCYGKDLPVGCNKCPQRCKYGLSDTRNTSTGCLLCICNTNTEIRQIHVSFKLLNVSNATLQQLSSGNNTFPQQVRDQIAEKFNISQTQVENAHISINLTDGVNQVQIGFYVRGTNTLPNPNAAVSRIIQRVATSSGLELTFAAKAGALFHVVVADARQEFVSAATASGASHLPHLPALILFSSLLSVLLFLSAH